jgi:ankyrin repeat protein
VFDTIFSNPFSGMAWFQEPNSGDLCESSSRAGYATGMLNAAVADPSSAQWRLCTDLEDEELDEAMLDMLGSEHAGCLKWDSELEDAAEQLQIVWTLCDNGADVNAVTELDGNTPLMVAAAAGNAALADILCRLGADTEMRRWVAVPWVLSILVFLSSVNSP